MNDKPKSTKVPFKVDGMLIDRGGKDKSVKQYILLMTFLDSTVYWEIMQSQSAVREWLINNIDDIDIYESFILVEDVSYIEGHPNVYEFFKIMEKQGTYSDGFDINNYLTRKKEENDTEYLEDNEHYLDETRTKIKTYQSEQVDIMTGNFEYKEV